MSETCDVAGCQKTAIVDLVGQENGLRCRKCMETDLNVRSVA